MIGITPTIINLIATGVKMMKFLHTILTNKFLYMSIFQVTQLVPIGIAHTTKGWQVCQRQPMLSSLQSPAPITNH